MLLKPDPVPFGNCKVSGCLWWFKSMYTLTRFSNWRETSAYRKLPKSRLKVKYE